MANLGRVVGRRVEIGGNDPIGGGGGEARVNGVSGIRAVLVEFVDDGPQFRLGVCKHREAGVGLCGLVAANVERIDLEGPSQVHDGPETSLHHPRVDDVARQFDLARDGHARSNRAGGKVGCGFAGDSPMRMALDGPLGVARVAQPTVERAQATRTGLGEDV